MANAAHPHPDVVRWLARLERGQSGPRTRAGPTAVPPRQNAANAALGARLYFYNQIVGRLPSHTLRRYFYRRIINLSERSSILMGLILYYPGRLVIGRGTAVNAHCVLDSRAGIYIGNNVSVSPYVHIWSGGHDINDPHFPSRPTVTIVEDYVWLGARSTVVGNAPGGTITLGEGCVVAANSLVVRDVPPYTVVAGIPARKVAVRAADLNYTLDHTPWFQ